jgi:thymidylate kinase
MKPVDNSRRMAATLLDPEPPGKGLDEGRFEGETDAFYRRVWEKYREIAAREPARVVLIEGDLSIEEVHERIVAAVAERLRAPARESTV